jgi:uncharacterized phiE125 gp8 family phage protein
MIYTRGNTTGDVVTLAELKAHLRIVHTEQDAYLQVLLNAAINEIRTRVNVEPASATNVFSCELFVSQIMPVKPVNSITKVEYYDAAGQLQTMPQAEYELVKRWPRLRDAIKFYESYTVQSDKAYPIIITAAAGYTSTPADLKAAVLLIAGRMFEYPADPVAERMSTADRLLKAYKY